MADHKEAVDIDTVAYDAPLSIKEPTMSWIVAQNRKGADRSHAKVPDADLSGKWIIISGSNNGIGREAAIQFAKWGANIILACRDPPAKEIHPKKVVEECLAVAKDKSQIVEWWEFESTKLKSVDAFAQRWLNTGRPLDILCNNAGIGSSPAGSSVFKTEDGFEIIHQVNFLSHVLLTLRLLPSLARAPAPRVVCTTSCFHFLGKFDLTNFNGELGRSGNEGVNYYQNNKLWFQVWLTELQRRVIQHDKYKHVIINGVHPGYVNSGIWNINNTGWLTSIYSPVLKVAAYFLGIDTQQGSLCILNAATTPNAAPGGKYYSRIWEETAMPHTQDADCRQRVWRKVNDELQLEKKGLLDVLGLKYVE